MFDFVDPARSPWRPLGQAGQTRFNSAVSAAATQYRARKIGADGLESESVRATVGKPRGGTPGPPDRGWDFGGQPSPVRASQSKAMGSGSDGSIIFAFRNAWGRVGTVVE